MELGYPKIGIVTETHVKARLLLHLLSCQLQECSYCLRGQRWLAVRLRREKSIGHCNGRRSKNSGTFEAYRHVVLLDDIASSGHTLARAAELLYKAGAETVDIAVTHALFNNGAIDIIIKAGVKKIWSTDCIAHSTNAVSILPLLAKALI